MVRAGRELQVSSACGESWRSSPRAPSSSLAGIACLRPLQVTVPSSETSSVRLALRSAPERSTRNRSGAGEPQPASSRRVPRATAPHTTTSCAPATSRRNCGVEITPSRRCPPPSPRPRPAPPPRRPRCGIRQLGGGLAQLGERAREGSRSRR